MEDIFNLYRLTNLKIIISRPNPDSPASSRAKILKRMEDRGIHKQELNFTSVPGSTIVPDEEIKTLAEVATSDGKINWAGRDINNKKVVESTIDFPMVDSYTYRTNFDNPIDILITKARELFRKKH